MYSDETFEDVLLFDVPSHAEMLCARLRSNRLAWVQLRDDSSLVAAALRHEPSDLATLLRSVQSWIAEHGFSRIRFELDGRSYTLRAAAQSVALAATR